MKLHVKRPCMPSPLFFPAVLSFCFLLSAAAASPADSVTHPESLNIGILTENRARGNPGFSLTAESADNSAAETIPLAEKLSRWTIFGGINFIYNSEGKGESNPQSNGTPGLASAPSPIAGFLGVSYRLPVAASVSFSPSASIYFTRYLFANGRALPAEIEHRTAFVPVLFLDLPLLYHLPVGNFFFSFGGGPAIAVRYGFLDSGVGADEENYGDSMSAGEQVDAVNEYLWSSGRWFYPTLQTSMRYCFDNGWAAGIMLRVALPLFNLWSGDDVPFFDAGIITLAATITPAK